MSPRGWWWVGAVLDLILLLPALYMAMGAVDIAMRSEGSPTAVAVASLFSALPIFYVLAPWTEWRARMRSPPAVQFMVLFPPHLLYPLFLCLYSFPHCST